MSPVSTRRRSVSARSARSETFPQDDFWRRYNLRSEWSIDYRHACIIFGLLCLDKYEHVVEIGALHGAITCVVRAAHSGPFTVIEPYIQKELEELDVEIVQASSEIVLPYLRYDFIIVDGNHSKEQVAKETAILLSHRPRVIVAHDTSANIAKYGGCVGPPYLKHTLQSKDYFILEDNLDRPGEKTDRGIIFATWDVKLFEKARSVFNRYFLPKLVDTKLLCDIKNF